MVIYYLHFNSWKILSYSYWDLEQLISLSSLDNWQNLSRSIFKAHSDSHVIVHLFDLEIEILQKYVLKRFLVGLLVI